MLHMLVGCGLSCPTLIYKACNFLSLILYFWAFLAVVSPHLHSEAIFWGDIVQKNVKKKDSCYKFLKSALR